MRQVHWIPPGCSVTLDVSIERFNDGSRELEVAYSKPTATDIRDIAAYLRGAQQRLLRRRPIERIIESLDKVAALWLDPSYPPRRALCEDIALLTGFSLSMVEHAVELEQRSSRRADMQQALQREFGDPTYLDGFRPSPKGVSMAIGPGVVGGIFSANIPALPHLTVMRSLLVKAACFGRVSRNEPLYLAAYIASVAEVDNELAECLAAVHWPHHDSALTTAFMEEIGHLVAYGGEETLTQLKALAPDALPATWHGHAMSFAYVGASALNEGVEGLADQLAYDFSLFDQHACLSPQVCFVESSGAMDPRDFAERLACHMERWLERLPPRQLNAADHARLRVAYDAVDLECALNGTEGERLSPPDRLQAQVVFEPRGRYEPVPLERFVRVIPVRDITELRAHLSPWRAFLQSAAVVPYDSETCRELAELGVSRLCPPGAMGTPTMVWRHDGLSCLERLTRWCDVERERSESC